jgi:hypothetical protein
MQSLTATVADWAMRSGMLAACAAMAWKVVKRQVRDESLRKNFPPHRHINGKILYPNEYRPPEVEHIHFEGDN